MAIWKIAIFVINGMNHTLFLREVQFRDINELSVLFCELFPVVYTRKYYEMLLQPEYFSIVLVERCCGMETIIGVFMAVRDWKSICSYKRNAHISSFGIKNERRRAHLGTDLMFLAAHIMHMHYGIDEINLDMQKSNNAAYQFYIKFGFEIIAEKPGFYHITNDSGDAYAMNLDFTNISYHNMYNDICLSDHLKEMISRPEEITIMKRIFGNP